jgi:hypothetical protein
MAEINHENTTEYWHKFFAIESNNRAWELSVRTRTSQEDREMLNAAHASAYHWQFAGTELNHMRAKMLLAEVHALLGLGETALAYAEEMRGFFTNRETEDWELAFTHGIYAHAAHAAGEAEAHRQAYNEAFHAFNSVEDEEERKILQMTFDHVPKP